MQPTGLLTLSPLSQLVTSPRVLHFQCKNLCFALCTLALSCSFKNVCFHRIFMTFCTFTFCPVKVAILLGRPIRLSLTGICMRVSCHLSM